MYCINQWYYLIINQHYFIPGNVFQSCQNQPLYRNLVMKYIVYFVLNNPYYTYILINIVQIII